MSRLAVAATAVAALALAACSSSGGGPAAPCDGPCDHLGADAAPGAAPDAATATCAGAMPAAGAWLDGTTCDGPDGAIDVEVHRVDADTFILRQSLCTSFEAPFLFLLFGEHTALLEDTGAGGIDVVAAVDAVIAQRLAERGQDGIDLLVVNSHSHGDHVAGNAAFAARARTTVVGASVAAIEERFGLVWPDGQAAIDLGRRLVDLVPIPGHQAAHLALFDRGARLLLTGDTLYPGRLYVDDFAAYRASVHRLVEMTAARPPCHVLGTHIELSQTPGDDYPLGATVHPAERALALDAAHLVELAAAVDAMAAAPRLEVHDDFIVVPLD